MAPQTKPLRFDIDDISLESSRAVVVAAILARNSVDKQRLEEALLMIKNGTTRMGEVSIAHGNGWATVIGFDQAAISVSTIQSSAGAGITIATPQ